MIEPEYDYDDMVMAHMAQRIDDCEALLLEAAQFLAELPQDLGRGSLNGWRVQLQHKIEVMVPSELSSPAAEGSPSGARG
jgi:hypothetical protein